ncbi:MAG: hypothetical protein ACI81L_000491 [Verrucomicrobiales bacterium]|jgi:hypothetical protein
MTSPEAQDTADVDLRAGSRDVAVARRCFTRAHQAGLAVSLVFAVAVSTRTGLGLAIAFGGSILGVWWAISPRSSIARWSAFSAFLVPWLVFRDNSWLTISIACTTLLVLAVSAFAAGTEQSLTNLSVGAIFRRSERRVIDRAPARVGSEQTIVALIRGVIIAAPIVAVFWALLASADEVFADIVDPFIFPFARAALLILILPVAIGVARFAVIGRPCAPAGHGRRFGSLESSVVLSAVAGLFGLFITLRLTTIGRDLSNAALRSEVRSGFFQLLWVAALTVVLVLVIRQISGSPNLDTRLRRLGLLTIALAAVIDGLALLRILAYVDETFLSPLRFWSFGFGLWLLIVLGLAALRVAGVRGSDAWFTVALVSSWIVFVFAMGALNPDRRIAEHNFANPPTGEDEWIAIMPLIWLSEDATPTIVENIEILRPMPNDRYVRLRNHICTRPDDESWRDVHVSRTAAREAIEDLC